MERQEKRYPRAVKVVWKRGCKYFAVLLDKGHEDELLRSEYIDRIEELEDLYRYKWLSA